MSNCSAEARKRVLTEIRDNQHYLELNLNNPDHYAYYMDGFGGEQQYFQRFPHLVESIQALQANPQQSNSQLRGEVKEGFSNLYSLNDLEFISPNEPNVLKLNENGECAVIPSVLLKCQFAEKQHSIFATINLYREDDVYIGSSYVEVQDTNEINERSDTYPIEYVNNTIYEYSIYSTITPVSQNVNGLFEPRPIAIANVSFVTIKPEDIVEKFTLDDPIIKNGHTHDEVFISYLRDGNLPDYDYSITEYPFIDNKKEKVKVNIPVSATITVKKGKYIDMTDTPFGAIDPYNGYKLWITNFIYDRDTSPRKGSVYHYGRIEDIKQKLLETDTEGRCTKLKLTFPEFWNTIINMEEVGYSPNVKLDIYLQFNLRVYTGISVNSLTFAAKSYAQAGGINSILVKKIKIQWGCFSKDSMLLMADKSLKRADEISIGDEILLHDGSSKKVENIYSGYQSNLIEIKTSTKTTRLSPGHTMSTNDGIKRAYQIKKGMMMQTVDGLEEVIHVASIDYHDTVYNFKFDTDSLIIGDGFIVGDYSLQNKEVELLEV